MVLKFFLQRPSIAELLSSSYAPTPCHTALIPY